MRVHLLILLAVINGMLLHANPASPFIGPNENKLTCTVPIMQHVDGKCVRYHINCTIAAALHPTQRPSSAGFSRCEAGYVVGAGCTEGHS